MDGPASWKAIDADLSGLTDFLGAYATTENTICYAHCRIVAPSDMDVKLSVGTNDGAKIWLNGEVVFSKHIGRGATPHQEELNVHLNEGPNSVLVKLENWGANWQLYMSADDPDRLLRFDVE
jgi:hypothetical protein